MKKTATLILSAIFFISFAGYSFVSGQDAVAAEQTAGGNAKAEKKIQPEKTNNLLNLEAITGKVTTLDAKDKTITINKQGLVLIFSYTEATQVAEGKKKKSLADLKAGTTITIGYTTEGTKNVAKEITIVKP